MIQNPFDDGRVPPRSMTADQREMLESNEYESLVETLGVLANPGACADLTESAGSEDFTTEEDMAALMRARLGGA